MSVQLTSLSARRASVCSSSQAKDTDSIGGGGGNILLLNGVLNFYSTLVECSTQWYTETLSSTTQPLNAGWFLLPVPPPSPGVVYSCLVGASSTTFSVDAICRLLLTYRPVFALSQKFQQHLEQQTSQLQMHDEQMLKEVVMQLQVSERYTLVVIARRS